MTHDDFEALIPVSLAMISITATMVVLGWKRFIPVASIGLLMILGVALASRRPARQEPSPTRPEMASATGHG